MPEKDEHSIEFFILGDIDKFAEIDGLKDQEFNGEHWQKWVSLSDLNKVKVFSRDFNQRLLSDYQKHFVGETKYLG